MEWCYEEASRLLGRLGVAEPAKGLSSAEAKKRLRQFGGNVLEQKKPRGFASRLLEQLSDFMVLVLLAAAVVSLLTSMLEGKTDYLDAAIIVGIVFMNALMGVMQNAKAEKAIEALSKLAAPTARVVRGGVRSTVKAAELVPGDIILLETGDYVPADARLLEAVGIKAEEASLTGESLPVEKDAAFLPGPKTPLADCKNILLATSMVVSGRGKAVVTATGMETQVGKIAGLLDASATPLTPLQKRLEQTGKTLGLAALFICAAIFAMGLIAHVNPLEMFMISVSLAVAAIPEGLPAVVTIVLAMGVKRMVKNNVIVRKLPAVETLGSATVICSDKTGTLTQNKMEVQQAADSRGSLTAGSPGYAKLFELFCLCSNAQTSGQGASFKADGEPTEKALVVAASHCGRHKHKLESSLPRVGEIPFDSTRKLMSTLHRLPSGGYRLITKGAPDILLSRCTSYEEDSQAVPLSGAKTSQLQGINEGMAKQALRVLAVGYKDLPNIPPNLQDPAVETGLTFCGFAGMLDPPRPEAIHAVRICKAAGIKPVMITGDHVTTAAAIANQMGIGGENVITGAELSQLNQAQLNRRIGRYSVFARVSPEHKAMIVKAYQAQGEVVAMTGDGVNDAPALKIADIGCAMGVAGTDVAKAAADMILTDDNFSSIVAAVREGRGIYENIRKAIHFLLSSNIGEILVMFTAFFLRLPTPLLPIQLLWVNLVTDSFPALALGVDGFDDDIMERPPISPRKGLFADGLALDILLEGCMIGILALLAFLLGRSMFDLSPQAPIIGRSMAFCVLSLSQLVHAFNTRSKHSLFRIGFFSNIYLVGAFLFCGFLQVAVVSFAPVAAIFKVAPLLPIQWAIVAGLSLLPLVILEIVKSFSR